MTADSDRLGARLRVGWTALLVAAGCTGAASETKQAAPTGEVKAEPVAVSKEVAPVAVASGSCPAGKWSGPAALARKMQVKGVEVKDGCPEYLHRGYMKFDAAEQLALEAGDGLPPPAEARLDVASTQAAGAGRCAYHWKVECPGGRALVGEDGVVLAEVRDDAAWTVDLGGVGALDDRLAEMWVSDARSEHASIASFARATLELLALAAPPALVHATQAASLDEVEHARVCFALASRHAGRALGPGPLPATSPRAADLVRLACDVFVEGCVGETIAALAATRAGHGCEDAEVRAALARISDDETRHAALAWATLAWACERGGAAARAAVRAVAAAMRAAVLSAGAPEADADAAALARHGRLDAAARHACAVEAWRSLIPGALDELLG
jgi:hypothetical protein